MNMQQVLDGELETVKERWWNAVQRLARRLDDAGRPVAGQEAEARAAQAEVHRVNAQWVGLAMQAMVPGSERLRRARWTQERLLGLARGLEV